MASDVNLCKETHNFIGKHVKWKILPEKNPFLTRHQRGEKIMTSETRKVLFGDRPPQDIFLSLEQKLKAQDEALKDLNASAMINSQRIGEINVRSTVQDETLTILSQQSESNALKQKQLERKIRVLNKECAKILIIMAISFNYCCHSDLAEILFKIIEGKYSTFNFHRAHRVILFFLFGKRLSL